MPDSPIPVVEELIDLRRDNRQLRSLIVEAVERLGPGADAYEIDTEEVVMFVHAAREILR